MILSFYSRTIGVQKNKVVLRLGIQELRSTSNCINKRRSQVDRNRTVQNKFRVLEI